MPEDERSRDALTLLATGTLDVKGRMPWSSNGTFLVAVAGADTACDAVYKPVRGERPLWDFPPGLYRREVAAFELDRALGWGFVPETIVRHDAPLGVGSLQRFVDASFDEHYFTLLDRPELHDQLRRIALFDILANNADRKSGHCLLDRDGWVWGIDHGVCFADEPKLRTVIWDFSGEEVPTRLKDDVARLRDQGLPQRLCDMLAPEEVDALLRRIDAVLRMKRFPDPGPGRPYPWPLV
ncbi:MAG TPA: SCO1664 family protein [Acidimicrobiales bacterium]|nr:SCO1664 family protein [Acidimicrobiales bacterium]